MDELAQYPVALDGVTRRFGDVVAVDGVSFALHPGTILGLIGPSGSGKTTLIRMLTGTLPPTAGRLAVLGEDPRRFRAATRERIGAWNRVGRALCAAFLADAATRS